MKWFSQLLPLKNYSSYCTRFKYFPIFIAFYSKQPQQFFTLLNSTIQPSRALAKHKKTIQPRSWMDIGLPLRGLNKIHFHVPLGGTMQFSFYSSKNANKCIPPPARITLHCISAFVLTEQDSQWWCVSCIITLQNEFLRSRWLLLVFFFAQDPETISGSEAKYLCCSSNVRLFPVLMIFNSRLRGNAML